jgi:hypothetical protein
VVCLFLPLLPAAMHGPIPSSFERLRRLEVLSLEVNGFSGTLPPHMCTNMTSLSVSRTAYPLCTASRIQSMSGCTTCV